MIKNRKELIQKLNKFRKVRGSRKLLTEQVFCYLSWRDLKNSNGQSYNRFKIPKKRGGYREVFAPSAELKLVQRDITDLLNFLWVDEDHVTGFVPDKSIVDNAKQHVGKKYVFNIDLLNFFPSIKEGKVKATLKRVMFSSKLTEFQHQAIRELTNLVIFRTSEGRAFLPQGSPCSPIISNFVCVELDRRLKELALKFKCSYSRYADDITFSSDYNPYEFEAFKTYLNYVVESEGFKINSKKTRIQKNVYRQEVTGLTVNEKVNVSNSFIKKLRKWLYLWDRYGFEKMNYIYMKDYLVKKNGFTSGTPQVTDVISGKIEFLKMVKGNSNSTFKILNSKFLRLNKLHELKKSNI